MKYLFLLPLFGIGLQVSGQSFYDLDKIQDIHIYFSQNNWDYQMDTAKAGTESYILADSVVVNGETFKNCGVKYKGNSSYDPGRAKNPLHIELDYDKDANYQGYTDIKLGNGWSDNSMIREPLCYAILRQYMDAPKGNFAKVYINNVYYGLMNNAESIDKNFLIDRFYTSKYSFFKCNPLSIGSGLGNGPNLGYLGTNIADYSNKYELKSDTGWSELIGLCDTLNNHYDAFAGIADVDRFLWMLAFNNALVNLDSYTGSFRQNYYLYRTHQGVWLPIVWDLNMCMGGFSIAGGNAGALTTANMPTMSHTLHKSESGWPLIFKLLNDPFYSKMYLAHLRTINNENFVNAQYKTLANTLHTLVDTEVQNDPNFLSTYANFQVSLTTATPGSNSAGTSPGIFTLMDARAAYLKNVLSAAAPQLSNATVLDGNQFGQTATVLVTAANAANVYLGYRYHRADRFVRVPMYDDGAHRDGAAGDGVFGADCPLLSLEVQYYCYAENAQTGTFLPERAEHEFLSIQPQIAAAAPGEVVINEITANNSDGIRNEKGKVRDWIELYNTTDKALGLSHLYLSNKTTELTQWQFPASAFIGPREHLLVWADDLDVPLLEHHTNFDLSKSGETLLLSDGNALYNEVSFSTQAANHAFGRCPDGTGAFADLSERSPRTANRCVSATQQPDADAVVGLRPNPAGDLLEIQSEKPIVQVDFYSADGRLCLQTAQTRVDVSQLVTGVYWLKLSFPGGRYAVRRMVKM